MNSEKLDYFNYFKNLYSNNPLKVNDLKKLISDHDHD